jgi:tetratricopeptide (TPR) repeat protein
VWQHVGIRRLASSALQELLEAEGFNVQTIDAGKIPEGTFIANLVDATETPDDVLFITDLGRTGQDGMNALNYQREVFVEHPLLTVFWVRESELNSVATQAPDFWVFRHRVVEFPELFDESRIGNLVAQISGDTAYGSLNELRTKLVLRNRLLNELSADAYSTRGLLLTEAGNMYWSLAEMETAREYFRQALAIAREIGDRRNEGTSLGNVGNTYITLGENEKASHCYEEALEIAREIKDRRGEGDNLSNLGNIYLSLGDTHKAKELYERALEIAREIDDREGEGIRLGNLGIIFIDMGDIDKAINFFEQAMKIAGKSGNLQSVATQLGNLGVAYAAIGEEERAMDHHNQALIIAKELGDRRSEGIQLGNLGAFYFDNEDYEIALYHFFYSLIMLREIKDAQMDVIRDNIDELREKVGEDQFGAMLAKVNNELGGALPDWDQL